MCTLALLAVSQFISTGRVSLCEHMFIPFLSTFVSSNAERLGRCRTLSTTTKETAFVHPLTFDQHVALTVGLYASSWRELSVYWQRLFLLQQVYTALRSNATVLDLSSSDDIDALVGHLHAARLSLLR